MQLVRSLLDLARRLVDLVREVVQSPQQLPLDHGILAVSSNQPGLAHLRAHKLLPLLDLRRLLLEVLGLREHAALLGVVGVGRFARLLLCKLGRLVRRREVERSGVSWHLVSSSPRDPVDQLGELLRVLARDVLDVTLEHEEVLGLDQNVELLQLSVVRSPLDGLAVEAVARG